MKKILISLLMVVMVFSVSGCASSDAKNFKKEYEALNGESNSNDVKYRDIKIKKNNPIVYATAEEVVEKIENKESFYVYFGSPYCPWCRSVIEKALEVAKDKKIDKIYYVNIWDGDHIEILRDTYQLNEENNLEKVKDGTETYYKLLEYFDEFLGDYVLKSENATEPVNVGEKRITVPLFVYIENGEARRYTEGISTKQTSSGDELTEEILSEEVEKFTEFFK